MVTKKLDKWMIVAIVFGVLFISSIVYIYASKYKASKEAEKASIFQEGVQYGYVFAIQQFVNSSQGCKPVSITLENKTMQFVDTSCLK